MGRRLNGQFDSFKMKLRRLTRAVVRYTLAGGVFYAVFMLGAFTWSTSTTEAYMVKVPTESPVLERIGDCESGNGSKGSANHYEKNGQVLLRANKNGTIDIGKFQINSIWQKKATELGLELTKEADNRKFAEWMYANKGTGDWSASAKCWSR